MEKSLWNQVTLIQEDHKHCMVRIRGYCTRTQLNVLRYMYNYIIINQGLKNTQCCFGNTQCCFIQDFKTERVAQDNYMYIRVISDLKTNCVVPDNFT